MKQIILFFLIYSSLQAFEYNLVPQKLAKGVYCFFGKLENISKENGGNMVNTCFVQTKEGFVVIDSGPTYAYASEAYVQMQNIAKIPIKYVINTHDHDDHWLGNSFYKSKGALLIGPRTYEQNVVTGMETRMERTLGKVLYAKTNIVMLDRVVDDNLTLKLGGRAFILKQLEDIAHTKGDLVVWLEKEKVLFVGDLVFNGRLTSLRDGSLLGSLRTLDKIDAYAAEVIVSGHGFQTHAQSTTTFKAYLTELKSEVFKALDEDVGLEKISKKVTMDKYKEMKLYDMLHARNVLDAYRELEMVEEEE